MTITPATLADRDLPNWGRVIPAFVMGGGRGLNPYNISYNANTRGYDGLKSRFLNVFVNYDTVAFQNPFGMYPGTNVAGMTRMRWDQATEAACLDAMTGGRVVSSFREMASEWLGDNPDRRIIMHMGSKNAMAALRIGDAQSENILDTSDIDRDYVLDAIRRNLDLCLVAPDQQTVSMDSAGNDDESSWTAVIIDEIKARGAKVLIEARPLANNVWHEGRDVLYSANFDGNYRRNPDKWMADDQLGDHYVLCNGHANETIADVVGYIQAGRNVLVTPRLRNG
ncbi:MAG: hypothetical protein AAFR76_15740, partial [Planctomycetota bacterium]